MTMPVRKRYYLIGDPVEQSPSPAFQQAAFDARGVDAVYEARRVEAGELDVAWPHLTAEDVAGFNVTIPHKTAVLKRVEADDTARAIGAVNTVKAVDTRWVGTNTDAAGLLEALDHHRLPLTRVALLGSGGAARAAAWALGRRGASVVVVARDIVAAREVAELAGASEAVALDAAAPDVDLVISTLPKAAFEAAITWLSGHEPRAVFDVAYGAGGHTPLTHWAQSEGWQAFDGSEMLLRQGAHAFRFWTAQEMPLETCRKVLQRHLLATTKSEQSQ